MIFLGCLQVCRSLSNRICCSSITSRIPRSPAVGLFHKIQRQSLGLQFLDKCSWMYTSLPNIVTGYIVPCSSQGHWLILLYFSFRECLSLRLWRILLRCPDAIPVWCGSSKAQTWIGCHGTWRSILAASILIQTEVSLSWSAELQCFRRFYSSCSSMDNSCTR